MGIILCIFICALLCFALQRNIYEKKNNFATCALFNALLAENPVKISQNTYCMEKLEWWATTDS